MRNMHILNDTSAMVLPYCVDTESTRTAASHPIAVLVRRTRPCPRRRISEHRITCGGSTHMLKATAELNLRLLLMPPRRSVPRRLRFGTGARAGNASYAASKALSSRSRLISETTLTNRCLRFTPVASNAFIAGWNSVSLSFVTKIRGHPFGNVALKCRHLMRRVCCKSYSFFMRFGSKWPRESSSTTIPWPGCMMPSSSRESSGSSKNQNPSGHNSCIRAIANSVFPNPPSPAKINARRLCSSASQCSTCCSLL